MFTGLVQPRALQRSAVIFGRYLLPVCLPPRWDIGKIPDSAATSTATRCAGLCQSQIVAGKAQSLELVAGIWAALAVSAYCLLLLTVQREASCSGVKFSSPQKCDIVVTAGKDKPVNYITKHNCVEQFVLFLWQCFNKAFFNPPDCSLILPVQTILKGALR